MVKLKDMIDSIPPSIKCDIHYFRETKKGTDRVLVFAGNVGDFATTPNMLERFGKCYCVIRPMIRMATLTTIPDDYLLITILYDEKE